MERGKYVGATEVRRSIQLGAENHCYEVLILDGDFLLGALRVQVRKKGFMDYSIEDNFQVEGFCQRDTAWTSIGANRKARARADKIVQQTREELGLVC